MAERVSSKEKILTTALAVIRAKGYAATTVDDLCSAAGVTKGAFFHHFSSKEDLAVKAAEHWATVTSAFFEHAPYQKLTDPLERLLGYIDFRKSIIRGALPEFTCLVGTMVQETYESSPSIRDACRASIFGHAAEVANDIAEAKSRYAPHARWSAESLGLHTQAVLQGSFILAKASGDPEVAAASIDHLRRYVELLFAQSVSRPKTRENKEYKK